MRSCTSPTYHTLFTRPGESKSILVLTEDLVQQAGLHAHLPPSASIQLKLRFLCDATVSSSPTSICALQQHAYEQSRRAPPSRGSTTRTSTRVGPVFLLQQWSCVRRARVCTVFLCFLVLSHLIITKSHSIFLCLRPIQIIVIINSKSQLTALHRSASWSIICGRPSSRSRSTSNDPLHSTSPQSPYRRCDQKSCFASTTSPAGTHCKTSLSSRRTRTVPE